MFTSCSPHCSLPAPLPNHFSLIFNHICQQTSPVQLEINTPSKLQCKHSVPSLVLCCPTSLIKPPLIFDLDFFFDNTLGIVSSLLSACFQIDCLAVLFVLGIGALITFSYLLRQFSDIFSIIVCGLVSNINASPWP